MKNLLDRNLKAYIIYALVVFLSSVPAYFLIMDFIWRSELHEHNEIVAFRAKERFKRLANDPAALHRSIETWNSIQPEAAIMPVNAMDEDSVYTIYREIRLAGHEELDRFHGLITYFIVGDQAFRITIETNIEESYETIAAITAVTAVFFFLLLGGFLLLNKKLSRRLWAPFHETVGKLEAYDLKSQTQILLPETNIIEFEALQAGIRKLISGNIAAYREQREFTENASHELQTPLAIVQSKLDLFLQTDGLTEAQSGIIEEANHSLSRVSRINRNLVLLAKIDNGQFAAEELLELLPVTRELSQEMEDFLAEKHIHLVLDAHSRGAVTGNRALVEIMLTNLFMNAIRHSPYESEIRISIFDNMIEVANSGTQPLPEDKLFKRFSAAAVHSTGTGLGLAIVRQVSLLYGWQVGYRFSDGMHRFTVGFAGGSET
ncbi:HAMP domain-containing sensor histidine kinase [Chitinophaga pollutisoli]|uniref:histidine kinase n=1 Tax=Chitinophaga pollutisoli TaxID=3133966 RepID=A0ABZ2YND2_9BACT